MREGKRKGGGRMTMTIQEAIEKINSKQATREDLAKEMGFSPNTLTRKIKKAGFVFDNKAKKYILASPNPEIQEINKPVNKQDGNPVKKQPIKQESKKDGKKSIQETRKTVKKVTYEIDEELHFEMRMKAFREKRNVSQLVEQAIKEYLKK